ncbi:FAD-dependent oxidoreductase [Alienimonas sp. DA493]|uniref:FAD-dependent oxidoreductase n=1 Tax=Alienimonas sp. DA493 TaxID=3373605 RepID=UPI00375461DD
MSPSRSRVAGLLALLLTAVASPAEAAEVFVEAESFADRGGWKLDTQFIRSMGSPYLLAHGLGTPVADATTTVKFPEAGEYRAFVRTFDWVARWDAKGAPGRFQLSVNGKKLPNTLGTEGEDWDWRDAGTVQVDKGKATVALHDLTGFDGRVDAVYFTTGNEPPPNDSSILPPWRRALLGLPEEPPTKDGYDLVVIGGGYSGLGAAISGARMGCKVALIQDRPVLGGNGSSEVRVWAMGLIRRGKYPRVGEIIEEIADRATKSPGTKEEFEDDKKEAIVRAEENIDLFLNHHAFEVETKDLEGDAKRITAVSALDTRTGEITRFEGALYADTTGHGTIGAEAGADWEMTPEGRMGMSNMWRWDEVDRPTEFPNADWALDLTMKDFPYPRDHHGQWFWESGFDKNPLEGAEAIRDWNLRAVYGAFDAMKNGDGAAKHKNAVLTWVAYVGGPRESRRLLGDVQLTQDDIVEKREFPDGCVPSTWSIDLHYPKEQYADKFPDNPFISYAVHDRRIDRNYGYPVPYRCFYSRNVENLFMAGRNISVTHQALGTTRVMKTCGMMGEVVGRAASICIKNGCTPRRVYEDYWGEMVDLLELPGKARRKTVNDEIVIPDDAMELAPGYGPPTGLDPAKLDGLVVDDKAAELEGNWTEGDGLKGYVGYAYRYASPNSGAKATFKATVKETGRYDVQLAWLSHENRGTTVPVSVTVGRTTENFKIDMTKPASGKNDFESLGAFDVLAGETVEVTVRSEGAGGNVHADAIRLVKVGEPRTGQSRRGEPRGNE